MKFLILATLLIGVSTADAQSAFMINNPESAALVPGVLSSQVTTTTEKVELCPGGAKGINYTVSFELELEGTSQRLRDRYEISKLVGYQQTYFQYEKKVLVASTGPEPYQQQQQQQCQQQQSNDYKRNNYTSTEIYYLSSAQQLPWYNGALAPSGKLISDHFKNRPVLVLEGRDALKILNKITKYESAVEMSPGHFHTLSYGEDEVCVYATSEYYNYVSCVIGL
ncbi:MAG TPA: hypothetical protein VNJ01_12135 [Bacteriovoracaceae bacterium]|nr:hypothetical protein [Bacteriovoracaceae bacterium]